MSDKPIALFYSHGGGGAVKGELERLFARLGYQVGTTVEALRAPAPGQVAACQDLGRELAGAVAGEGM